MRANKISLFFAFFTLVFHDLSAQTDLNYARTPAQMGILLSPGIVNNSNKICFQFKSRGDTLRWRANFNYFDIVDQKFDMKDIELISMNDSSANYRVWYDNGYSADLRLGIEKRKYTDFCNVQYWLGADALIGYLQTKKTYWNQSQAISGVTGSPGFYNTPGSLSSMGYRGDGIRESDYFKGGFYVFQGFSFIWLERLCVEVRSSAEFDFHFKIRDNYRSDPDNVLTPDENWFFDFRLSIIEIGINYVFRH